MSPGIQAPSQRTRAPPRSAITVHGLLLVAAVALPLALAALSAWSIWRSSWHEAEGEMRRDAASVAEYAGRVLDGYRQATDRVADLLRDLDDAGVLARQEELRGALHRVLAGLPALEAAAVSGSRGQPLIALPRADGREQVPPDLLALLRGMQGPARAVAPLESGERTAPGFAVACGHLDESGDLRAVGVAVRAAGIAERLATLGTGPGDVIALMHADGAVLARAVPGDAPPSAGRVDVDTPLGKAMREGVPRGAGRGPSALDGVERLMAFRRVEGWPVYAVVARPTSVVTERWREAIALPVLLGLASAALLALLGLLVRRHQRAIEEANLRLEQRVAERTVEVAQALAAMRAGDERLRLAIEAAGFGSWEIELGSGMLSRSGLVIPEQPGLPLTGSDLEGHLEVVHPEDRERVRAAVADMVLGRADRSRAEYRVRHPDGRWIWAESYGGVVERDEASGAPRRLAGVSRDVTERRLAEAALRASETRLRVAMEAARFSTWEYDVPADRGARRGYLTASLPQIPDAGFSFADWLAEIHPEDRDAVRQIVAALVAGTEQRMLLEFRVRRPDGGWATIESAGAVAERDPQSGAVLRLAGVARDVTEQRMAAQRQALLAREVDHRAKNALAVVQAALRLTPKTDAASYAQAVEGRVRALARAHTLLAEARWEGASLHTLASAELAAFLPTTVDGVVASAARATIEGPDLTLAPAAAQGLSMALHELATNATKYGALSASGGRVALTWRTDPEAAVLRLRWEEREGPPIEAQPERRGFGSRVMEATVRDQLGGQLLRHWEPGGLVCEIEVPLGRALGSGALEPLAEQVAAAD